jgi:hypothetical protein
MVLGEVALILPIFQSVTFTGFAKLFFILPISGAPMGNPVWRKRW